MGERRTERREDVELMIQIERIASGKRELYFGGLDGLRNKLHSQLRYISETQKAQAMLQRLESHHPDIANYLYTLENRLQSIGPAIQSTILDPKFSQEVNLSSSGMRAKSMVQLAPGDEVLLRGVHLPTESIFVCLAQVVYTQPPGPDSPQALCKTAMQFSGISDQDSKAIRSIIAHCMMQSGEVA